MGGSARARELFAPLDEGERPDADDMDGVLLFPRDRRVTSFDGTEIAYTVLGRRGPWAALVPGFTCPDNFWRWLGPDLARDHRVIVWDLRGLGLSGLPRAPGWRARRLRPEDFTIEALAADLEAVLDAERVRRAAVVGHSMGGQTILEFYRRAPKRVASLVFLTAPFESPLRTFYGRDLTTLFEGINLGFNVLPRASLVLWRALWLTDPRIPHRLAQLLLALGRDAPVDAMAPYYRHLGKQDPLVLLKMIRSMHGHSAAEVLPTVAVATLIVAGELDMFTPLAVAERMHEEIPGSELVVVEGARHGAVIEKPDEVNRAVRDFLERRTPARGSRPRGGRRPPRGSSS